MKHGDIPANSLWLIEDIRRETLRAIEMLKGWPLTQKASPVDGQSFEHHQVDAFISTLNEYICLLKRAARFGSESLRFRLKRASNLLLDRPEARVCALLRAFARCNQYPAADKIEALGDQLSVWKPLPEIVRVKWVKKSKGGHRPIVNFGPMRTAQCLMVRDMLSLMGIDSELDFTRKGGGGERALLRNVCTLYTEGYTWWWTPDIKSCFASIRPGHFRWLPIDRRLLKNVMFLPKCAEIEVVGLNTANLASQVGIPTTTSPTTQMVRRGLPQGSVLSPLLARAVVGRILRHCLSNTSAVGLSYSDDLTIGARTKSDIKAAQQAVTKAFSSLPAGPIEFHGSRPRDAGSRRVVVLGYRLEPGHGYGDNPVHVKPGFPRTRKFREGLARRLAEAGPNADLLHIAEEYRKRWFNSQQAWTKVPVFSNYLSQSITLTYVVDFEHNLPMG